MVSPLTIISSVLSIAEETPAVAAISIQAIAKIFGQQASAASENWSGDQKTEMRNLVASIKSGLRTMGAKSDIEVQERAFELSQLLDFVDADLSIHISNTDGPTLEDGFASGNPPYPKSLFLLKPLFTSHQLSAVASHAQLAVSIPDGLELEHDFVPGGGFPADLEREEQEETEDEGTLDLGSGGGKGMDELRRVIREQEEGDKTRKGKRSKGKGKKVDGEVAESKADRQKVSC